MSETIITDDVYKSIIIAVLVIYGAANVTQKVMTSNATN